MVTGIDWATTTNYLVLGWQDSAITNILNLYEVGDNVGWTAVGISGVSANDRILGSISYFTDALF